MKRRDFLKTLAFSAASMTVNGCASWSLSGFKREPNILFIFSDDQSFEALGILGSEVHTPHLVSLVSEGILFTNAYNQGAWSGAVCVASRTMLNTSRFLWNAQAVRPYMQKEYEEGRLWAQYFSQAGYDTYFAGKWHVNIDVSLVFDEVLADDAVEYITQASEKEQPFFMYLAFNAPHDPRQAPKEYIDLYPLDTIKVPDSFLPEYPYKNDIGCGTALRDERLAPFPRTEYAVKVNRQEYYAIITHMDEQIGRIIHALETSAQKDNTYIFFASDNGLALGHHGLMGKQNMFDHSMKVPLIVSGPGLPRNKRISAPVYLQDIMPTTLELARQYIPEHIEFKSLIPLIDDESEKSYEALYGGYKDMQRMVRKDNFKLIYYPKINKTLLFDLKSDPLEMHNLADSQQYSAIVLNLKETLKLLQSEVGDRLVIDAMHLS